MALQRSVEGGNMVAQFPRYVMRRKIFQLSLIFYFNLNFSIIFPSSAFYCILGILKAINETTSKTRVIRTNLQVKVLNTEMPPKCLAGSI